MSKALRAGSTASNGPGCLRLKETHPGDRVVCLAAAERDQQLEIAVSKSLVRISMRIA
jgi:hypothetical protein